MKSRITSFSGCGVGGDDDSRNNWIDVSKKKGVGESNWDCSVKMEENILCT